MGSNTPPAVSGKITPFHVSQQSGTRTFRDPAKAGIMLRRLAELERLNPKAFALAETYISRHHRGTIAAINGHWKGGC